MYRILDENQSSRERRNQLTHPKYRKPELLATGPNEVWSWDITKLKGPEKWTYDYLYVILHSDRGPSMTSNSVAHLLGSLGVTKSHSRPHVSNDNPFSESQFKTMKYRPDFAQRFGSYEDAWGFSRRFFDWYNREHHHSGIGMMTPASLHYGQAKEILSARANTRVSVAKESCAIRPRNTKTAATSQGGLDQRSRASNGKEKRSPRSSLCGGSRRNVIDAPSIRLSLGWLRPRRAIFRFTRHRHDIARIIIEDPSYA